jgi:hypothetical protein
VFGGLVFGSLLFLCFVRAHCGSGLRWVWMRCARLGLGWCHASFCRGGVVWRACVPPCMWSYVLARHALCGHAGWRGAQPRAGCGRCLRGCRRHSSNSCQKRPEKKYTKYKMTNNTHTHTHTHTNTHTQNTEMQTRARECGLSVCCACWALYCAAGRGWHGPEWTVFCARAVPVWVCGCV